MTILYKKSIGEKSHTLRGLTEAETLETLRSWGTQDDDKGVLDKIQAGSAILKSLRRLTGGSPRMLALMYQLLQDDPLRDTYDTLKGLVDAVTPYYKGQMEELPTQARRIVDGLARRWDPVKARDLAADLRLEPNTVSAQLNKLVKDGWAEKVKQGLLSG